MEPPVLLAAAVEGARPILPMALIGGVLLATFVAIAFELLHKSLASVAGAIVAVVLALFLGVFPGPDPHHAVHGFIAHDLNVIGVIVGTSILVGIAGRSGLFHFIAIRLVKLTGGKPTLLLPAVLVATVGFVTFLVVCDGVRRGLALTRPVREASAAVATRGCAGRRCAGTRGWGRRAASPRRPRATSRRAGPERSRSDAG